jgi:hypothetical protein
MALFLVLLPLTLFGHDVDVKQEVIHKLTIPWPSGIMVDTALGRFTEKAIRSADSSMETQATVQEVFRVGRNQHNSVQMRPNWSHVHVFEKVCCLQLLTLRHS